MLALVLAVGCGRVHFDPIGGGGQGDGSALRDAPVDSCPFGVWSAPMSLPALEGLSDDTGPQLAADGVTLYFASNRAGSSDLFSAVRPGAASPFGPATALGVVNSTSREDDPTVTDDQLDLLFDSNRSTGSTDCIYESIRTSTAMPWTDPTVHGELCAAPMQAAGPFISSDGLTLYYTQHGNMSALGTIMVATRTARGAAFTGATAVAIGGSVMLVGYPSLSRDGLTMYFEMATPTLDLYTATRPDLVSSFGVPVALPFNEANQTDQDAALSADERELFYASVRPGGAGGNDIYVVTRACL